MNGESVKTRLETDFATTNMPCEDHASMLGTKRSHSLALEVKNVPYCTTQQEDTSVRLSDRKHEEIIPVQCEEQRLQSPMSKLDPTPRSQSTQNVKSSLVTSNSLHKLEAGNPDNTLTAVTIHPNVASPLNGEHPAKKVKQTHRLIVPGTTTPEKDRDDYVDAIELPTNHLKAEGQKCLTCSHYNRACRGTQITLVMKRGKPNWRCETCQDNTGRVCYFKDFAKGIHTYKQAQEYHGGIVNAPNTRAGRAARARRRQGQITPHTPRGPSIGLAPHTVSAPLKLSTNRSSFVSAAAVNTNSTVPQAPVLGNAIESRAPGSQQFNDTIARHKLASPSRASTSDSSDSDDEDLEDLVRLAWDDLVNRVSNDIRSSTGRDEVNALRLYFDLANGIDTINGPDMRKDIYDGVYKKLDDYRLHLLRHWEQHLQNQRMREAAAAVETNEDTENIEP